MPWNHVIWIMDSIPSLSTSGLPRRQAPYPPVTDSRVPPLEKQTKIHSLSVVFELTVWTSYVGFAHNLGIFFRTVDTVPTYITSRFYNKTPLSYQFFSAGWCARPSSKISGLCVSAPSWRKDAFWRFTFFPKLLSLFVHWRGCSLRFRFAL